MSESTEHSGEPIACTLSEPEQFKRRQEIAAAVAPGVGRVEELADGYAFAFPGDATWADRLTQFIVRERGCCPFLTFELLFEPGEGPIWLRVRGPEGVKQLIKDGLNIGLTP